MSASAEWLEQALKERFAETRRRTIELAGRLTPEDMMVQSCPEASPAKWHLAHTAWFFESFLLREFLPGYREFHPDFVWLFNSYYQSFAAFPEKRLRASFSRPGLEEVLGYRRHVDEHMARLLENLPQGADGDEVARRVELGVNHEAQHQELLLTDTLHAFFTNPLRPVYLAEGRSGGTSQGAAASAALEFLPFPGGLVEIGHAGQGFCFDNELGRHRVWLEPYQLASRLVTCREYAAFLDDGGYRRPELWLSAGWDAVQANNWQAPLYWDMRGADRRIFTLRGDFGQEAVEEVPVSHISYYEADAYARWAGARLATEFEWEAAAASQPVEGNLLDSLGLRPSPAAAPASGKLAQLYGDCWEWTASAYLAYPGFKPLGGALGEYNGKFMSGQMVLRGGSCATAADHIRAAYRNFFPPETRWQFSGIRLAQ